MTDFEPAIPRLDYEPVPQHGPWELLKLTKQKITEQGLDIEGISPEYYAEIVVKVEQELVERGLSTEQLEEIISETDNIIAILTTNKTAVSKELLRRQGRKS